MAPQIDADDAETHFFSPIIDCFSMYATGVTHIQIVVLRRIGGGHGHFRSRDKDGGHTIRSAITEPPCCTQTSELNRSYCRHINLWEQGISRIFRDKQWKILNFQLVPQN